MIELVDEGGYQAVTVRGLARRAGVSTRAFYEHFANLEECFVATYERLIATMARETVKQLGRADDWPERLQPTLSAWARNLAAEPLAARFALLEAPAAGPAVAGPMQRSWQQFGALIRRCFLSKYDEFPLSPLLMHGILVGVARVARARLLAERTWELPELAEGAAEWVLSLHSPAARNLEDLAARSTPSCSGDLFAIDADGFDRPATGDDRAMILAAAARLAASEGYDELSVPRIRAAAGVSRRSFDAEFDGLKECFLEALEFRAKRAFSSAIQRSGGGEDWPAAVYRTLVGLCAHIARDPERARAIFIEVFAVGMDGLRCRESLVGGIGEYLRTRAPVEQRPASLAAEASAAAVWGILQRHIVTRRTAALPSIAPTLSYLVLAPGIGAPAAIEAIQAERKRSPIRRGAGERGSH
ncbi:MAG TPA: TetR/AcrR family transcriptional regulator [Solirubrobacterales bacterium]